MDAQTHKQKRMRKMLRRLVVEVAATQGVMPDSVMAAKLTFFLAAGLYQSMTKNDIVAELKAEIDASRAAVESADKTA